MDHGITIAELDACSFSNRHGTYGGQAGWRSFHKERQRNDGQNNPLQYVGKNCHIYDEKSVSVAVLFALTLMFPPTKNPPASQS